MTPAPPSEDRADSEVAAISTRWQQVLGLVVLLLSVIAGATIRIEAATSDPNFDVHSAKPLLRSDPALLYYITERIIDGGGMPPADFTADPRIEYPDTSDIPSMFTVGQEFLVAWLGMWFDDVPLHMVALRLMAIIASLTVIGVYGLAHELTKRTGWAIVAALMFVIIPGNYRTIGFILIREDLSLPLFSLHLWLLARCVRVRTPWSIGLAAATLTLAAATWHAMAFVIAIEVACVFVWFLRTGQNPMAARRAWIALVVIAVLATLIPVLRSKAFVLSLPMLVLYSLALVVPLARRLSLSGARTRLAAVGILILLLAINLGISAATGGGRADYAHVFELMWAKLTHFGVMPADPNEITFDTRLLWQGPFQTSSFGEYRGALGVGLLVIVLAMGFAARGFWLAREEPRIILVLAFVVVSAIVAWLIKRTLVLPAMLVPVATVACLVNLTRMRLAAACIVLVVQFVDFGGWLSRFEIQWLLPADRNAQLAQVIDWVGAHVPGDEAIASDYISSTAFLAHTGNPEVQQPKYETTRSRRRIEELMTTFIRGTPDQLQKLLTGWKCRYLVVHRPFWLGHPYTVGISPDSGGVPRTAAIFALCHSDRRALGGAPQFELLYPSSDRFAVGQYRVFKLR